MKRLSLSSNDQSMLVAGPLAGVCAKALAAEYGDPEGAFDGDADRVSLVLEGHSTETMQQSEDRLQRAMFNAIYLAKTEDRPMTRIYATNISDVAEDTVKEVLTDSLTTDAGAVESVILIDGVPDPAKNDTLASFESLANRLGMRVYYNVESLVASFKKSS